MPDVEAVSICTPPSARFDIARQSIGAGLHTMLEKPPCANSANVDTLIELARANGVALFASWHSRAAAAVEPARRRLRDAAVRSVRVTWHEHVRDWHPGQAWIWQAGGFGALDPGVNALSLLTTLLPGELSLVDADLDVPSNCAMPAAARLRMCAAGGIPIDMDVDILRPGKATWDIEFDTAAGRIVLSRGGAALRVDGDAVAVDACDEYAVLYERFAALVRGRGIDADAAPLRIAEQALATGTRRSIAPFRE